MAQVADAAQGPAEGVVQATRRLGEQVSSLPPAHMALPVKVWLIHQCSALTSTCLAPSGLPTAAVLRVSVCCGHEVCAGWGRQGRWLEVITGTTGLQPQHAWTNSAHTLLAVSICQPACRECSRTHCCLWWQWTASTCTTALAGADSLVLCAPCRCSPGSQTWRPQTSAPLNRVPCLAAPGKGINLHVQTGEGPGRPRATLTTCSCMCVCHVLVVLQQLWGHVSAGHIPGRELSGRTIAAVQQHTATRTG